MVNSGTLGLNELGGTRMQSKVWLLESDTGVAYWYESQYVYYFTPKSLVQLLPQNLPLIGRKEAL